mmetsp:Transcript_114397/g.180091  ORF Transcript_114397/g.180091 Transcript_114397/m.180091 type:complete len:169 (-) Transcript_114397:100-606(-)
MSCGKCCDSREEELEVKTVTPLSSTTPGLQTGSIVLPEPAPKEEKDVVVPPPAPQAAPAAVESRDVPATKEPPNGTGMLEFEVKLAKTADKTKVGLDVDHGDEQTLEVMLVKPGLVEEYNNSGIAPEKQIKTGDRIISVNGVKSDNKKMLETVGKEKELTFIVQRKPQ